jgi:hypothetical protein
MGRRSRKKKGERVAESVSDYTDADGNVLTLREHVSEGTARKLADLDSQPAASAEDRWQRRSELLFERFAVRWVIFDLPITQQKELLGRYRMADAELRRWVRETIDAHIERHQPELLG